MSIKKKHDLSLEFDKVKGIAKRMYDSSDIATGFFKGFHPRGDPQAPVYGVGSGAGEQKATLSPITAGIYWPTPEPMLDAALKILQETKAKKTKLMPPGRRWEIMGQEVERNEYLELIAEKLREENRINADPHSEILCTNGIAQGMFLIPMMLIDPGDEILVTDPDYIRLRSGKLFGAKIVSVPLRERKGVLDESRWYFDPAELERRITEKSKLFSFCNPNNPTGYVYSEEDLQAIARIAKEHDLFVLTNECYERMDFSGDFKKTLVFNSLAALPGMRERTFTLQGLTKAFETEESMTMGWIHGPGDYISILKGLSFAACQKWGTALGNWMGIAALTKPFRQDYARLRLQDYRWGRDLLWELLNRFSWIECGKAKGGPFMFPDVSGCGMSDAQLAEFLRERGVGVGSGTGWAEDPECGAGHIRLSYCSPRALQREMLAGLEEALLEYEVLHKDLIAR